MADNVERVCPYYVATVLGRNRSAVLCYDWGLDNGSPPADGARIYFDSGALNAARTVCKGDYERCGMYRRLRDRLPGTRCTDDPACGALHEAIGAMVFDLMRDRQDD